MNIAVIAHDTKKELMVQFCIAYCGILSKHKLCGTNATAKVVSEATGLNIHSFLSGRQGGFEQISSLISCDEIDALIFFRDPHSGENDSSKIEMTLLRLCDARNIPIATNIATAEILVCAIDRGDLDWREIVKENR